MVRVPPYIEVYLSQQATYFEVLFMFVAQTMQDVSHITFSFKNVSNKSSKDAQKIGELLYSFTCSDERSPPPLQWSNGT